jgi:hypothetical protein
VRKEINRREQGRTGFENIFRYIFILILAIRG